MIDSVHDHNFPKCGQSIEIIGPSLKTVTCTVVGSFYINNTSIVDQDTQSRLIGVPHEIYQYLATTVKGTNGQHTQVTIRQVQSPFNMFPSLEIIESNTSHSNIKIYNQNEVILSVESNGQEYYPTSNGNFYIPNTHTNTSIKVQSIHNTIITFKNIDTSQPSSYSLDVNFPATFYTPCDYYPNNVIFSNDGTRERHPAFSWLFFQIDNNLLSHVGATDEHVEFIAKTSRTLIVFGYGTVMQLGNRFSDLKIVGITTGKFELATSYIGLGEKENQTLAASQLVCSNLKHQIYTQKINETSNLVHIKISLNSRCVGFGNLFILAFRTTLNSTLQIKNAKLILPTTNTTIYCGLDSMLCNSAECNGSNSSHTNSGTQRWEIGCQPECGFCQTGYECDSTSKCISTPNQNTRNSSVGLRIFFVLFLIVVL